MNSIQRNLLVTALLIVPNGYASEYELRIDGTVPGGMEQLATNLDSHTGVPENRGHHGLVEYCYRTEIFVVYGKNLHGHGYQLSRAHPENLECVVPAKNIVSTNRLGMFIGMPKKSVEKIIGVGNLHDKQTIIWLSDTTINEVVFDVQTYAEIGFKDNKLEWTSVFTTTTN